MKKMILLSTLLISTTFAVLGLAYAGDDWGGQDVYVDLVNNWAFGNLGAARNSSDTTQYVRCSATAFASGWAVASCEFSDANGTVASCYATNPEVIQIVLGMSSDSRIDVQWDANTSECIYISFETGSIWEPKLP